MQKALLENHDFFKYQVFQNNKTFRNYFLFIYLFIFVITIFSENGTDGRYRTKVYTWAPFCGVACSTDSECLLRHGKGQFYLDGLKINLFFICNTVFYLIANATCTDVYCSKQGQNNTSDLHTHGETNTDEILITTAICKR